MGNASKYRRQYRRAAKSRPRTIAISNGTDALPRKKLFYAVSGGGNSDKHHLHSRAPKCDARDHKSRARRELSDERNHGTHKGVPLYILLTGRT